MCTDGASLVSTRKYWAPPRACGYPREAPSWQLKAFEDKLDAIICAWAGICVFEGTAVPFGDDTSAIWIPRSEFLASQRGKS